MLEPLLMQPYYRYGTETPWGGEALRMFGRELPGDHTGESLEISALPGRSSVALNGRCAGMDLAQLQEEYGEALSGRRGVFPLLVKLIDARDRLSVQVHPGDDYALPHYGIPGKTEAWIVLSAAPGAQLFCGLKEDGGDFAGLCGEPARLEAALNRMPVRAGDVLYIPHGLVHALGEGIMVYELQQSSDLTFRIWDWGRMGLDGRPRTLHLAQAQAVVRQELRPALLPGASLVVDGGLKTLFVCDANFAMWRLNVSGEMPLEDGRMQLLTALSPCALRFGTQLLELSAGQSALVPADCGGVRLVGKAQLLLGTLPDREGLREAFGARAGAVAALCD